MGLSFEIEVRVSCMLHWPKHVQGEKDALKTISVDNKFPL